MSGFGAQDQIEALRAVLSDLLHLHFCGLTVGQVVPTSFSRRHYEVEVVNFALGRTAWLRVTEDQVQCVRAGNRSWLHESLKSFVRGTGLHS